MGRREASGKSGTVALALSLETFDLLQSGNAAPCAERFAVETGGGAGEVQSALQLPALQNPVTKTSVKEIAGAGGVYDANFVGRRIPETAAVPSESAVNAESGADGVAAEFAPEEGKSFEEVGFASGSSGEVARDDGIVDERENPGEFGGPAVEVGDDGDLSGAGPARRAASSGGIVAVDIEQAGARDPMLLEEGKRNAETRVPMPDDGAFAGVLVDEDEGKVAGRVPNGSEFRGNALAAKGAAMKFGDRIVAHAADVVRAESPAAASNHGGGDLSPEKDLRVEDFGFVAGRGEAGELVDMIGGIFADAEDVEFSRRVHVVVVQGKRRNGKCKARERIFASPAVW